MSAGELKKTKADGGHYYRTHDGRFTASYIKSQGRCYPAFWVLVDNKLKKKFKRWTLKECQDRVAEILRSESEVNHDQVSMANSISS